MHEGHLLVRDISNSQSQLQSQARTTLSEIMTAMTDIHLSVSINDSLTRVTPSNNTTSIKAKLAQTKKKRTSIVSTISVMIETKTTQRSIL